MIIHFLQIICILSQEVNDDVECWLRAQSNGISSHYICVESVPSILDASRCHLLQFGCATNGLRHVERKVKAVTRGGITFEKLCQGKMREETSSVLVGTLRNVSRSESEIMKFSFQLVLLLISDLRPIGSLRCLPDSSLQPSPPISSSDSPNPNNLLFFSVFPVF